LKSLDSELLERLTADASDDNIDLVVAAATGSNVTDQQIAGLARVLADSGEVLHFPDSPATADVASTGGPSSLSTLLCPLFLRLLGAVVPKLGVPGRPAGAVDVLAQIPGYQVVLDAARVKQIVQSNGYAHCLTSERLAPLDGIVFERRRATGAVAVPTLAIASLLSKKLAFNVRNVGLDVRVAPHGNFGKDWAQARVNAQRFVRVAALLGIRAKCFLSSASEPCQPYIGRSEALLALDAFFRGTADSWLKQHIAACFVMCKSTIGDPAALFPGPAAAQSEFERNVVAQGGSLSALHTLLQGVKSIPRRAIEATADGFVAIDLATIRDTMVATNDHTPDRSASLGQFSDRVGIVLRNRPGDLVLRGHTIAEIRCSDDVAEGVVSDLSAAIRVVPEGTEQLGFEEV